MANAYEIVMNNRKELVDKLIQNMEKGYFLTEKAWNSAALRPYNPASDCFYLGGNRARLMIATLENNYNDPRWCTYNQAKENGWDVRRGAKSVILEKWIFEETKTIENEFGELEKKTVELERPKVNYFRVFNAEQIHGIPKLKAAPAPEYDSIIKAATDSSKCPILEKAIPKAHYIPAQDVIEIPSRFSFKSAEAYLSVQIHEMAHSTGHPDRLNRSILNTFGTSDYAREELRAELSSAFFKANLNIPISTEQLQDHSNYLKSWIQVLKEDPNEFFRACKDAERISGFLYKNYTQELEKQATNSIEKDIDEYFQREVKLTKAHSYVNELKEELHTLDPEDIDYQALQYELVNSAEVQLKNVQNEYDDFIKTNPEFLENQRFWTINIDFNEIPTHYTTVGEALNDYLLKQSAPGIFDSRAVGFITNQHEYCPLIHRDGGIDIVNPDKINFSEISPSLGKFTENLLEALNPDCSYMDRIELQLENNHFHMTDSLKRNLENLHSVTGKQFYLRDFSNLAYDTLDFGAGHEFAEEIYQECRQQEIERIQTLNLECIEEAEVCI